ncbi:9350_t:CDS:2, partial [Scutellospora calospora]
QKTIANDLFRLIDSIQISSTKNSQECYNDNENFSDSTITEITEISKILINDIENIDPHSIHRRNTTRVHNKC